MIKKLILVRHGQSVGNVNHALYSERPDYAISLTEVGHEQARERGQELNKLEGRFACFVSTHFRTRQTFDRIKESIGGRIIEETFTPLIREQEWSNSVGKHADLELEKERLRWGVFHYRFPGGESCADVLERLELFNISRLLEELVYGEAENVLVVGHGMAMRLHIMSLLNLSVEEFELLRNPKNCGTFELEFDIEHGFRLAKEVEYRQNRSHIFEYQSLRIDALGETEASIHKDWAEEFA